jgi:DNA repair photolyase
MGLLRPGPLTPGEGRGAGSNPPNRFERTHREPLEIEVEYGPDEAPPVRTLFFPDTSRTLLAKNDSPDVPFTFSLNPYRGCEHGCVYCYARPSHEYLGFSAGLDFESRIMVKLDAPELLERELSRPRWEPQIVALSGNTDCYQPAERSFRLTRRCLEVLHRFRNPAGIITKNSLLLRDLDLLVPMARLGIVEVMITVTTLDADLARTLEPRASSPAKRLEAVEQLSRAGVPVGVHLAPVIPGLTDEEIPAILNEAARRGAGSTGFVLLRLPGAVEPLFKDWVERHLPERAGKILGRIRGTRGGSMSDSRFGTRMRGTGSIASSMHDLFTVSARKAALRTRTEGPTVKHFRRPSGPQTELFASD